MLVFEERGKKRGTPGKTSKSRLEPANSTYLIHTLETGYRTQHILMGGMRSHHCISLPVIKNKVLLSSSWSNLALLQLSLLEYDDDGDLDQTSIIPVVDGGTEGKEKY